MVTSESAALFRGGQTAYVLCVRRKIKTRSNAIERKPTLTVTQAEIAAQFADYAFDYPNLTFDEVARKITPKGFGTGPSAKAFKKEAKAVFDQERNG
jgi:hypothetical protein